MKKPLLVTLIFISTYLCNAQVPTALTIEEIIKVIKGVGRSEPLIHAELETGLSLAKINASSFSHIIKPSQIKALVASGKISEYEANNYKNIVAENRRIGEDQVLHPRPFPNQLALILTGKTFISMPEDAKEFKKIFGQNNRRQLQNLSQLKNKIFQDKLYNYNNYEFSKNAVSLINELSKKSVLPIFIIGHNVNGLLLFPDGSSISFEKIDSIAKKYNRVVIYLSCNAILYTKNPATRKYLTYDQAIQLGKHLGEFFNYTYDFNQADVLEEIQGHIDDYKYFGSDRDPLIIAAVLAIGGIGVYEIYKRSSTSDKPEIIPSIDSNTFFKPKAIPVINRNPFSFQ